MLKSKDFSEGFQQGSSQKVGESAKLRVLWSYRSDFISRRHRSHPLLPWQTLEQTLPPGLCTCWPLTVFTWIMTNGPTFLSSGISASLCAPQGPGFQPRHLPSWNTVVHLLACFTTILWAPGAEGRGCILPSWFPQCMALKKKKVCLLEWVSLCRAWKYLFLRCSC